MKITIYLDVLSLWCLYATRSLERLRTQADGRIAVSWRIAPINGDRPLGYGSAKQRWFYRRGAFITGSQLNPEWLEGPLTGTREANLAALAARSLGHEGLEVPHALMDAAMVEGKPVARREVAIAVVASATDLSPHLLDEVMDRPEIALKLQAENAEMLALGARHRPTILVENVIPDRAVLSGVWAYEPIAALYEAMRQDEERFLTFNAANPAP